MKHYANIERMKKMMHETDPAEYAVHAMHGEVQQYMLYAASDDVFFGPASDKTHRPKGITLPEAKVLIERVRASEYARLHWPKFAAGPATTIDNDTSGMESSLEFLISHGWGAKFEGAYTDDEGPINSTGAAQIHLADNGFAMQPQVVLHELGHAVEAFERPTFRTNGEAHGAAFARTNIELVREFLSPVKAKELENAFAYAGVHVAPATQSQPHTELMV